MRVLFCVIFLFGNFWELKSLPPSSSYSKGEELFALRIAPILQEKCFACHSEKEGKLKGDLDLSSLEGMIFGGETSEKVLVPQKPEESLLLTAIEWKDPDYEMPPKENDNHEKNSVLVNGLHSVLPLAKQKVQDRIKAERKIQTDEGIIVNNSGGLSDDWTYRRYKPEDLWAFQAIKKPKVSAKNQNPVDYFISKHLSNSKISPAPP